MRAELAHCNVQWGPSKHSGPIQEFAFRKQGSHFSKRTKSHDFPRFFLANFLAKLFFCLLLVTACCLWISQVLPARYAGVRIDFTLAKKLIWEIFLHIQYIGKEWKSTTIQHICCHTLKKWKSISTTSENTIFQISSQFSKIVKFHDIFMIRKVADTFPGFQGAMVTLNK